jgi:hypothetical protein
VDRKLALPGICHVAATRRRGDQKLSTWYPTVGDARVPRLC